MTSNSTQNSHTIPVLVYTRPIWSQIEFGLFLFGQIMSIPCYFFMMYHLVAHRTARNALHNHVIIIMLIYNFMSVTIDLSMAMQLMRFGYISPLIPALCLIQQFVDYGFWYGALHLMLWASIERHILIFHSALVATMRKRLLVHYIPIAFFSLYAPILYFYWIFLFPVEPNYDPTADMCNGPFFARAEPQWYGWYEALVNYTIPVLLILVFSVGLIIRVIVQKRRIHQTTIWRRNRKMILQLLFVSAVYLIFDLPYNIIAIVQWSGISDFGNNIIYPFISHLTYVPGVVLPYATLVALPDLKQKLRALIICKAKPRAIAPAIPRN